MAPGRVAVPSWRCGCGAAGAMASRDTVTCESIPRQLSPAGCEGGSGPEGLCSPDTHRPEIRSVSALMYGPRSWEMPLAPSARICRIRSSSGKERARTALAGAQSSAPCTTPGHGSAPAGAGDEEEEQEGDHSHVLPWHSPPLPPVLQLCPSQLGHRAASEGQVLLLHHFQSLRDTLWL